jgi:hypothetical protein
MIRYRFVCPREKEQGSGHTAPFNARMAHPEDGQRGQVSS